MEALAVKDDEKPRLIPRIVKLGPPKLEPPNIDEAVKAIEASIMEKARYVKSVGSWAIAADISKAISLLDISRTARSTGNPTAADAYADRARLLLLGLLGIKA